MALLTLFIVLLVAECVVYYVRPKEGPIAPPVAIQLLHVAFVVIGIALLLSYLGLFPLK